MMRNTLCLLAWIGALGAGVVRAQVPPQVNTIGATKDAYHFLDSLARSSFARNVEDGACVPEYAVTDSSLELRRVNRAKYDSADVRHIWADFPGMCPWGQPTIHTHIEGTPGGSPFPSPTDRETARIRGTWNAILNVSTDGWRLLIY